jgi:pullulanase/glycogen debranching enzyme
MSLKILSGRDDPLGAIASADGTNFAVSSGGDEVTLCLFDADGVETRLVLPERRRRFLAAPAAADLRWFTPSGTEMTDQNWTDPEARAVAVLIDGSSDPDVAPDGTPLVDDDFLVFVNAWWEPLTFQIPADVVARRWEILCDTFDAAHTGTAAGRVDVGPRSTVVLGSQASPSRATG